MEPKKNLEGMTLAIFALIFSFLIPIVAYICGGIGLHKANMQIKSDSTTPVTVKTICIISMIMATIVVIVSACLSVGR